MPITRKKYTPYNETPFERTTTVKKIDFVKKAVSTIVGIGTAKIVKDIIENNVETNNIYQDVTVGTASVAIGYAVSDYTSAYTDTKIDEAVALWHKLVTNRNKTEE